MDRMENILQEIGLTENETKVYIALNQIGQSTVGKIVAKSKINNSKVYIILDKLIDKGLVSHININKVKNFKAADPIKILTLLEEKKMQIKEQEEKIKDILPQLVQAQMASQKEREIEVYEGFQGLKTLREESLKLLTSKDDLLILGGSKFSTSKYEHYWENYHTRRIVKKIPCKYLLYEETREVEGKKRSKWKHTKVKYLKQETKNPARIDIYLDYVVIAIDAESPFAISVKSKQISDSFRNHFEEIWKQSNK
ncbi:MAG: sugar-specific transcriptional regulator TrmB [Patescibacteria group bacterium]